MNEQAKVLVAKDSDGVGYKWPNYCSSLILEHRNTEGCEIYFTHIQPGELCPRHEHQINEQVYYVISGLGEFTYSQPEDLKDQVTEIGPGDVVFSPRNTEHEVRCIGSEPLVYLCVDVFPEGKTLPGFTWDESAKVAED